MINQMNMRLFTSITSFVIFSLLLVKPAFALSYGNGTYTNLCGTGFAATADTCNKGCSTSTGSCSHAGNTVVSYSCDGWVGECRNNESSFTLSQSLGGTPCGRTKQIDVFSKTCRVNGNWVCGDGDLLDYMVWYSGDCKSPTATPYPTSTRYPTATPYQSPYPTYTPYPTQTLMPTVSAHKSSCDSLSVVSGNYWPAPATVTFRAKASDNKGNIQQYRFYFGDGKQEETPNPEISHRYESSGSFSVRVDIKDAEGIWKTSDSCKASIRVTSLPVESHKSDCSDLFILEGNATQAPTTVKIAVSGFDNKGQVKKYKVDFGNGVVREQDAGSFDQRFEIPGTYTVRGFIQDSKDTWKGGSGSCTKTLYVNTKPIASQPKTGTLTTYTLMSLLSGLIGTGLLGFLVFQTKKT